MLNQLHEQVADSWNLPRIDLQMPMAPVAAPLENGSADGIEEHLPRGGHSEVFAAGTHGMEDAGQVPRRAVAKARDI